MAQSLRDQMLKKGLVKPEDTAEAKWAKASAARAAEPEKELPPAFEAPARGVIATRPKADKSEK